MFVLLLISASILLLIKAINHFTYWKRHGVHGRPFLSYEFIFMTMDKFLIELRRKCNNRKITGGFRLFSKILTVNDAQVAHDLSVKELHKFALRSQFYIGESSLSKSLFFLEANSDWKRIRNIVTPAFTSGKLKAMMEPISEIADQLVHNLYKHSKRNVPFDIKPHIDGFTMDVIARCAYGVQLDSVNQSNHPIIQNAKRILNTNITIPQTLCMMSPRIAKILGLSFFDSQAIQYFDKLTETIIQTRQQSDKSYNDLIGLMMKQFQNGKNGISLEEISAQSVLFFIAGYDTTNAAFDHILYYLSKHPQWQEKLYEELQNIPFEYDKAPEFSVLNAIIYETLRLKPSLIIFERVAKMDCELLDTGIPILKGTTIAVHPYIIHRDPNYFEDPESFKPERFIGTGLENNVAYMPFGVGLRFCVGMRFALNELRIGIATFFKHFMINLPDDFELEYFKGSALLSPKNLNVILSER